MRNSAPWYASWKLEPAPSRRRRDAIVRAGISDGEVVIVYPSDDVFDGARVEEHPSEASGASTPAAVTSDRG